MIDEPLASHWRYDLGHRKIFEFRSSLGLPGDGPAPASAVFAYGVVPGLARALTLPQVAAGRSDLRLSRVEAAFASELDMRGELICTLDLELDAGVVAKVSCEDAYGARAVATIHLTSDHDYEAPQALESSDVEFEVRADPARCVAFAAATWDLNPAYWDREFAEVAGLGGTVAPPGLPLALALQALEDHFGAAVTSTDISFDRAARPGDVLQLRAAGGPQDLNLEVASEDGIVLHGTAVFGGSAVPL